MNSTCLLIRSISFTLALLIVTPASGQLNFNFFDAAGNPAAGNVAPNILAGFQAAGQRWSGIFDDNITVNLQLDFAAIPAVPAVPSPTGGPSPITLAQTAPNLIDSTAELGGIFPSFSLLKNQLALDQTSANDAIAVNNLPVGNLTTGSAAVTEAFSFLTNDRSGTASLDNDTSLGNGDFSAINNSLFAITSANARALGLINANDANIDATITVNSGVNFDFDPSDGIAANAIDFVGIATHEIGHALGFVSGVDTIDARSGPTNGQIVIPGAAVANPTDFDQFPLFSTLDLFRRSNDAFALDPDALDLSTNPNSDVFFSIDGVLGDGNDILLETGEFNGTGFQASHFGEVAGASLGILDPVAAPGELLAISQNDILAFDVIGFDLIDTSAVPEPNLMLGLAAIGFASAFRRRRRA